MGSFFSNYCQYLGLSVTLSQLFRCSSRLVAAGVEVCAVRAKDGGDESDDTVLLYIEISTRGSLRYCHRDTVQTTADTRSFSDRRVMHVRRVRLSAAP